MKMLLIENGIDRSHVLTAALKAEFLLESSNTFEEGQYLAETNDYSLVVIHSQVSYEICKTLCKKLRANKVQTPILVLSQKKTIQEKVEVIEAGADDYLSYPTQMLEVLTHIKALSRRVYTKQIETILQIDDLILDISNKSVTRSGKTINLRRKEYDLLEYFMQNPGRVISREMILNHVWTNAYESYTNTIDVHIKYLRDQIDKPFTKKLIKTIHGFGYKISV
jgi:DNA-binding response OmpR family regulator